MTKIRTRVAPSPTGDPHVGTAYIALFNRAFAKGQGGDFILRVEDTDQARSTRQSEEQIMSSLKWLGLTWDEGPDCGGDFGPYRQSERKDIYKKYCDILIEKGHAFHCFCTPEELAQMREEQVAAGAKIIGYDGRGKNLSKEEVQRRIDAGEDYVIRMDVPREGNCTVTDMLRDPIDIPWEQVDMQVLLKSDGMPSYHLASVVDDHLMEITHVIRGEEWINSTPKHLLLYQYFGWEAPTYFHLPLLRNADKSKLSKRKNPTSIDYYRRVGVLPEALVNYLGMMGWTMPDGKEKFSVEEMTEKFDINRVSLGGPVFDMEKLTWLNGKYIREDHDAQAFASRLVDWAYNADYVHQFLPLVQERVELLSDVAPLAAFFFSGMPTVTAEDFAHKSLSQDEVVKMLQFALWKLEAQRDWQKDNVFADVKWVSEQLGIKFKDVTPAFFRAISGQASSVSVFAAMEVLGPDLSRARIRHAIQVLGGVSKKQLKKLEKEFAAAQG